MSDNINHKKILIVEDDAIVASQLQRIVNALGYTALAPVATGIEAVNLALKEIPDVILMDIKLKGELTGIEAADLIHKESEIPVIYLTAYADQETIRRSKDRGTYGFLTKPVRDKELGAMIETAIYKSSTDRSLKHLNQLLKAIRNIDKLITRESIPEKLLHEACSILVNSKDYLVSWISYEQDPASNPLVFSEKFKKSFKGGVTNHFIKKRIQNVLEKPFSKNEFTLFKDSEALDIVDRLFTDHNIKQPIVLLCPMLVKEKFFGYIIIVSQELYGFDTEEIELLQTLGEDIAFALNSIEIEKERILAEQALSERESYYRSLLHSMHEDILVIDRDYNIVDANNSTLKTTGYATSEILGKKCYKISHNLDMPCCDAGIKCELQNVFDKGLPKLVRHIHKKNDGQPVYVDVLYSPLKDETGKVTKVIKSIHDVTDLLATQEALHESEERIKQIADNIDIVLFTLSSDENGEKLTYLSPAFNRVWGMDKTKALDDSKKWLDTIYLKDRQKLLELINKIRLSDNLIGNIEYRIVRPDGSTRWINSRLKAISKNSKSSVNIIGIAEDITDRILTENKLKRSEQAYKNLFDNAHDAIIIFEPERGIILNTNTRASEVYGLEKFELIGTSFYTLCSDKQELYKKVTDAADFIDVPSFEIESIGNDGKKIHLEVNLSPTDFLGQKAIIAVNRDISFRKNAEKELRFLSEIVKQSPASVLLTNTDLVVEYVNPKFIDLTGFTDTEVIGQKVSSVKPLVNQNSEQIWSEVKEGNIWMGEVLNVNKDLQSYWTSLIISPITKENGKIIHFLLIEQDITQQKELELELKNALNKAKEINNFKTHLLGNLNHEIRTPMNSIIGFSQIMAEEAKDEDVIEMSNKIIKSSYRLLNTLNSIIELSDLESERLKINRTEINVSHFVRYLDYSYKSISAEKKLFFEVDIKKEDIIIQSDEKLLEQIFRNLIDNAIKYTEKGGITITVNQIEDEKKNLNCFISVKDTGIGIPEKNRNVIFDAFRQLSEGVTRKYEGTGLGLTIANKMVSLLDGKLKVESKENAGSEFSVILPLNTNNKISSSGIKNPFEVDSHVVSSSTKIPHLLIVEDYLMNVDIMKYFLSDIATMDNTTNYEETLAAIEDSEYDIILMDINLKDSIGGVELMKEIRKTDRYKNAPIIAITGYTSSMDQEIFMQEGFTGFLAKPFNQMQLKEVILKNLS